MLDLSFGVDPAEAPVGEPEIDHEKLNRLIGVLSKKSAAGEEQYLIALTFDELVELVEFLEENALESEKTIQTLRRRLETKVALIEKRS